MNSDPDSKSAANPVVIGAGLGVVVALPALMAAMVSGGGGHGDYAAARALFPVPMLLTLVDGRIGPLSISVALLQFPLYGALIGWSVLRRNYLSAVAIVAAHLIAALVCFSGTLPNFS